MDIKEIARIIWNIRREDEDRCDLELEDIPQTHSVWKEAEALVAEIQRHSEPVAWGCPGHPETFVSNNKKQNSGYQSMVLFSEPLFTFPPDKAKIEQRVAEAMFEALKEEINTSDAVGLNTAGMRIALSRLERGDWRKFVKGE